MSVNPPTTTPDSPPPFESVRKALDNSAASLRDEAKELASEKNEKDSAKREAIKSAAYDLCLEITDVADRVELLGRSIEHSAVPKS